MSYLPVCPLEDYTTVTSISFFEIKKKLLNRQKKGEHKGIRYITNIDSSNAEIAKLYLAAGIKIKHVKNLPPMSFGVSDKEMGVTIERMEGGQNN